MHIYNFLLYCMYLLYLCTFCRSYIARSPINFSIKFEYWMVLCYNKYYEFTLQWLLQFRVYIVLRTLYRHTSCSVRTKVVTEDRVTSLIKVKFIFPCCIHLLLDGLNGLTIRRPELTVAVVDVVSIPTVQLLLAFLTIEPPLGKNW